MKIIKFMNMINQGVTIKDKLNLVRFILFNTQLPTYIENNIGRFYCDSRYQSWAYNYRAKNELNGIISENLRSGDTFIDVGANIGAVSFLAGHIVGKAGKVYSFEPEKKNLEVFQNNIKLNSFLNIFPQPFACIEKSGYVTFNISRNSGEHSTGNIVSPSNFVK